MKYLVLFLFIACGADHHNVYHQEYTETASSQSFEGIYFFENGSCLQLSQNVFNEVTFEKSCQTLVTTNPKNNSLGQFPVFTNSGLKIVDNEIKFFQNVNYNSSSHDIEKDLDGGNITGTKRTDFLLKFEGDTLVLNIKIYDSANLSNLNKIIANRTFRSL